MSRGTVGGENDVAPISWTDDRRRMGGESVAGGEGVRGAGEPGRTPPELCAERMSLIEGPAGTLASWTRFMRSPISAKNSGVPNAGNASD
ncbi:MAG: hypothetical protein AB7J35_03530 [Dehalococcoidia bacterium]